MVKNVHKRGIKPRNNGLCMSIKCHKQYTGQATGHVTVYSILALDYTQLTSCTENERLFRSYVSQITTRNHGQMA